MAKVAFVPPVIAKPVVVAPVEVVDTSEMTEDELNAHERKQRRLAAAAIPKPVLTAEQQAIAESRTALKHPLSPGTKFFESPEGYIVVAEEDRPQVWCRQANKGKGMNINPRR
ncbi:MAG: hypothetical protein AAB927_01880 [Patescibacteria group bacterium]